MPDGLAIPALSLLAIGLVALALVWPQGQGAQSPAPFGHPIAALPAPIASALKTQAALRGPQTLPKPAQPRAAPR